MAKIRAGAPRVVSIILFIPLYGTEENGTKATSKDNCAKGKDLLFGFS